VPFERRIRKHLPAVHAEFRFIFPKDIVHRQRVGSRLHFFDVQLAEFSDIYEDLLDLALKAIGFLIGQIQARQMRDVANIDLIGSLRIGSGHFLSISEAGSIGGRVESCKDRQRSCVNSRNENLQSASVLCFQVSLYGHVENFEWKEFDDDGKQLLKESGPLAGVRGLLDLDTGIGFHLQGMGEVFFGRIDYDGATQAGDPIDSKTKYSGFLAEVDLIVPLKVAPSFYVKPCPISRQDSGSSM
jgi:hypothetical protein